jgi:hypothetical protein
MLCVYPIILNLIPSSIFAAKLQILHSNSGNKYSSKKSKKKIILLLFFH